MHSSIFTVPTDSFDLPTQCAISTSVYIYIQKVFFATDIYVANTPVICNIFVSSSLPDIEISI